MTAVDRDHERRILEKLRGISDRLAGDTWLMDGDADGIHVIARRSSGEEARILTMHPEALADEQDLIAGALDYHFLLTGMVWRAMDTVRELRAEIQRLTARADKKPENFGFQAKSLCEKRGFWKFLEGKGGGGPIGSALAAETRMKGLLRISSKGELNDDRVKRDAFLKLRRDYYDYARGGQA